MKPRKLGKKQAATRFDRFKFGVEEYLFAHGAEVNEAYGTTDYTLDTPFGSLHCSLHGSSPEYLTVFCRFDEPERVAGKVFGANPHTGKWNFHYGEGSDVEADDCVRDFERTMSRYVFKER